MDFLIVEYYGTESTCGRMEMIGNFLSLEEWTEKLLHSAYISFMCRRETCLTGWVWMSSRDKVKPTRIVFWSTGDSVSLTWNVKH